MIEFQPISRYFYSKNHGKINVKSPTLDPRFDPPHLSSTSFYDIIYTYITLLYTVQEYIQYSINIPSPSPNPSKSINHHKSIHFPRVSSPTPHSAPCCGSSSASPGQPRLPRRPASRSATTSTSTSRQGAWRSRGRRVTRWPPWRPWRPRWRWGGRSSGPWWGWGAAEEQKPTAKNKNFGHEIFFLGVNLCHLDGVNHEPSLGHWPGGLVESMEDNPKNTWRDGAKMCSQKCISLGGFWVATILDRHKDDSCCHKSFGRNPVIQNYSVDVERKSNMMDTIRTCFETLTLTDSTDPSQWPRYKFIPLKFVI